MVSKTGKEATIGILVESAIIYGEGTLAGQVLRMGSAAAIDRLAKLLAHRQKVDVEALRRDQGKSGMFVALSAGTQYSIRRGPGRSAFQFQ